MVNHDHHCGVIGTCIAQMNIRFFASFLFFAGLGIFCGCFIAIRRALDLGILEGEWNTWKSWEVYICGNFYFFLLLSFQSQIATPRI
jgi:hypothetical protein